MKIIFKSADKKLKAEIEKEIVRYSEQTKDIYLFDVTIYVCGTQGAYKKVMKMFDDTYEHYKKTIHYHKRQMSNAEMFSTRSYHKHMYETCYRYITRAENDRLGFCNPSDKQNRHIGNFIVIKANEYKNGTIGTLHHEIAHYIYHGCNKTMSYVEQHTKSDTAYADAMKNVMGDYFKVNRVERICEMHSFYMTHTDTAENADENLCMVFKKYLDNQN